MKILYLNEIRDKKERQLAEERFRQEAWTLAQMDHPHIVQAIDYGEEKDTRYLVTEYAPYGSLSHRHPLGERLPLTLVRSYARHIGSALDYLHAQGLIHRDIKPGNMLLGTRNRVLLGDFGLVIRNPRMERSQIYWECGGTRVYMAPEQFRGEPCPASDQYALALVMYEWLTGCSPFDGSVEEATWQRLHFPMPSLRTFAAEIPVTIDRVILTALQRSPYQRYARARDFIQAFEEACEEACRPAPKPAPVVRLPYYTAAGRYGILAGAQRQAMTPQYSALGRRRASERLRQQSVEDDVLVVSRHSGPARYSRDIPAYPTQTSY